MEATLTGSWHQMYDANTMKAIEGFPAKPAMPKQPPGILGGFIQASMAAYRDGDFSRTKENAVLLNLTNIPLTRQAEHLGVSPGVLRTWRSEKKFQDRAMARTSEFLNVIGTFGPTCLQRFIDELNNPQDPEPLEPPWRIGFGDAIVYSDPLVAALWKQQIIATINALRHYHFTPSAAEERDKHDPVVTRKKRLSLVATALGWMIPTAIVARVQPDRHQLQMQAALASDLFELSRAVLALWPSGPADAEVRSYLMLMTWLGSLETTVTAQGAVAQRAARKKMAKRYRELTKKE